MKKLALTMALVLVMGLGAIAQEEGGLFGKGGVVKNDNSSLTTPRIPNGWNNDDDVNGPIGSGVAVLIALGGAYFVAKKRKED